jgi:hypothetical protein
MRSLMDQAVEQDIIPRESRPQVDSWMRTRNEVVHSSMPVPRALANEIVSGVLALLARMNGV